MLSLFKSGPKALATFTYAGSEPGWRDFVKSGSTVALSKLLLWEVNEGGGENVLFLLLEAAFQRSPTVDGMGLLISTFVSESGPMQLNITSNQRNAVMNNVKLFYSQRLGGKSLMQFKQQKPPSNVFAAARDQAETDTFDILLRMGNGGGFTKNILNKTVQVHAFALSQDEGMTKGRTSKIRDIQQLAQAAQKMGLNPPTLLFSFK